MTQLITTQNNSLQAMQSQEPPENPHSMVRRLAEAAFRSKGLLVLLAALGGTIGAAVGILKPNEYVSTATFLFRHGSEQVAVRPSGELPRDWGQSMGVTENAPHLLIAPTLARRTVERVGVAKIFQPFKPKDPERSWITKQIRLLQASIHARDPSKYSVGDGMSRFLGSLKISSFRRASLLNISYTANHPLLAQEILQAYVGEATKFHIEMYDDHKAVELVKANYANAQAAYEKAKRDHAALLRKSGLQNFELEFATLQLESTQSRRELRTLVEQDIPSLEIHITEAQKSLKKMSPRIERTSEIPLQNQMVPLLNDRIFKARDDLMAAEIKFKRSDAVEVVRVQRRLAELKSQLKIEHERLPKLVSRKEIVSNQDYAVLKAQLDSANIELVIAKQNITPFTKRAKRQKELYDAVAALAPEYRTLANDLTRTRADLRIADAQLVQSDMKQRLAQNQLSTLKLIGKPTFKPSRTGPRRGQMALLGLLAGFGLAFVILSVRTMTDTTIRTPEELEKILGLRVLATVPELRGKHVRRHENRILSGC